MEHSLTKSLRNFFADGFIFNGGSIWNNNKRNYRRKFYKFACNGGSICMYTAKSNHVCFGQFF